MSLSEQQHDRLTEILQVLGAERASLRGRSVDFVDDMIKRHDQYGADVRVSPAQWKWLEDLYKEHAEAPDDGPPHDERGDWEDAED